MVDLLEGETVLYGGRTSQGFLVVTNLGCLSIGQRMRLLLPHVGHSGPEFPFYNLKPPRVELGQFVVLQEEYEENGWTGRFLVQNPNDVAASITETMAGGRAAWAMRRPHAEAAARVREHAPRGAGDVAPPVLVRCAYCGNLTDERRARCTSGGAPLA
ncbi:MAG: hypothetical protein ACRECT_05685 [Thermoplasmata archaeon]